VNTGVFTGTQASSTRTTLAAMRRGWVVVDRGRLTIRRTSVGTVVGNGMGSVVDLSVMAVAVRLFVFRVDVSATSADAASEQGTVVVSVDCVATATQNQRTGRQGTATAASMEALPIVQVAIVVPQISHHWGMRTGAKPPSVPVHVH
jgi:hypothetical protein